MKSKAVNSDPVTAGVREVKDDITAGITEYLGVGSSMANRREYLIFLAASLLVSLGILALLGYIYLWPLLKPYYAIISDKEKLSGIFRAAGDWAPIVYILLEVAQVLTMFWPVPLEIAGGFLFGLPLGIVYSMIGLTTGGVLAFLLGRWLERTYLRRILDPEILKSFRKLMKREGALAAFIIFLVPGVPKDFASYALGFTPLSLKFFVVAVAVFRLPSTLFGLPLGIVYSMIGLTLGAVVAFLLGRWLERTYLTRVIDPEKLLRFQKVMKREGTLAAFIIYLVPGVPKDFVSYALGFTTLSLKFFVVAVAVFRLPSTFLLTLQGAEAAKGHYWLSVGLLGFNYLLAVLIYRYREYLYQWIKAWHPRRNYKTGSSIGFGL